MKLHPLVAGALLLLLLGACDGGEELPGDGQSDVAPATPTEAVPSEQPTVLGGASEQPTPAGGTSEQPSEPPATAGQRVRIAFSAPGAAGGWLKAITDNAIEAAAAHDDVELIAPEGTPDSAAQIKQVERLIAQDPDALVLLPHDGAALTPVAQEAMAAGIPVVNLDNTLTSAQAYRTFIGGDNYGVGVAAGRYFATELGCRGRVVEIQGAAGIGVTAERSVGFRDAIDAACGRGIRIVARQPADFSPQKGLRVMEGILKAQQQIDAVYTHDDVMAGGVAAAIRNAGRQNEMFITGVGGSADALGALSDDGLFRATFLYSPSMAASAVNLARLIALGESMADLTVPDVPQTVVLQAATVTEENVEQYRDLGF